MSDKRTFADAANNKPCTMGVGCDEAGVCYAAAHGRPDECPKNRHAWDDLFDEVKHVRRT
jgi:hypothetical protein